MADSRFFSNKGPFTLAELVALTGAELYGGDAELSVTDVAPLDKAGASEISFLDNSKYIETFSSSQAGACFVRPKFKDRAPQTMALLLTEDPYRAYAKTAQYFYPAKVIEETVVDASAKVAKSATIGNCVEIGANAFIGENVKIGDGTVVQPNAAVLDGVEIGKDCMIGACSAISHSLIGDRVIIHRGVCIGQDGFGFAMGPAGHLKVPQLGRVVIEDDVEIGAGTCIDRGAGPDTHIGAGAKIDNLVQIGHNVVVGKSSIIVSQTGISGSTQLGAGVVMGGQVGVAGHLQIGSGAQLAARTGVTADLDAGKVYGGTPAVPIKDWHRQVIALNRLSKKSKAE